MNGKKKEKRILKGYKIRNSVYAKAIKRASKKNMKLATTIEHWVECFAEGYVVGIIDTKNS